MRIPLAVLMLSSTLALPAAAQVGGPIIWNGSIAPGVYGRVEIGSGPPPPLVYADPIVVQRPAPRVAAPAPIYLAVPPGHAKHWDKHCRKYNACDRPVYFVRSEEYEPKHPGKGKGHAKGRHKDD